MKNDCKHLNPDEQNQLLEVLFEFEDLFSGTLGDWNTEPVSFELKEGSKSFQGKALPIPQKHKVTVRTEVDRLCKIEVLEWQPTSEWAAPLFIQPKKNNSLFSYRF